MKKDNNRKQDSQRGSQKRQAGKGEYSPNPRNERGGRINKSTSPERGTDQENRWSTRKENSKKSESSSEKRGFSLEGHPKKKYTPKTDSGKFNPKGKQDTSSRGRREDQPKDGEFKTVYKGRGKDERPVFETIKKTDKSSQGSKKKFIKVLPAELPKEPRPEYNFDTLEKKLNKSKKDESIRLNKYISNAGICSRREADNLIQNGEIRVNGEIVTELGYKVAIGDSVTYKSKRINPEKPVYVLLNKPKDFITTTDDPMERKTVMQLVSNACKERIFPVGRLDRNTTGLLLFTNDGDLAAKLSHPSNQIKKIYQVTLDKPLTKGDEEVIMEGFDLEDGPVKVNDMQVLSKDRTILGLEIHIGRNRIVRRIFAHFGYEVIALDRVMYAGLDKKDLTRGHYRFLTEKEVINLKYFK
ncbi:pseudouridine synthase [Belliella kenyensis]|uniref:Pseudouridine synthase n=1 Tax=Belliella kenyensis TaxID=1472724 RepID=A0ABV8EGL4_9BACT|nr:pseudouridine synthase [Belliella kenyensis]MCH7402340.1 rRNA pseudouridine synthase [Belliella kenyensis]MDN3603532.1 pseudouridine synthase [Belliella kenyensis]